MLENPLQGPLEGVGPKNRDFLGPWQLAKRVGLCAQKVAGPCNGFTRIKIIMSHAI